MFSLGRFDQGNAEGKSKIHSDKHEHLFFFLDASPPCPRLYKAKLNVTTKYKASPTTHLVSLNSKQTKNGEQAYQFFIKIKEQCRLVMDITKSKV